jgi:hypothetical protein
MLPQPTRNQVLSVIALLRGLGWSLQNSKKSASPESIAKTQAVQVGPCIAGSRHARRPQSHNKEPFCPMGLERV